MFLPGLAWAAEPVAVLTEIRIGQGDVQVKRAGDLAWTAPQPLLALGPGDQLRATGDGRAVIVFIGGGGSQTVSSTNSPFTIQAPTGETGAARLRGLLASVTQFLLGQGKEPAYQSLSVRSARVGPPLILSPRESRILPGPVIFEWAGSDRPRYRVRIFGPHGLVWERANLPRQPLPYPPGPPALQAGVRYTWELEAEGYPRERAQFELVPPSEAERVQAALALLEPATLADYPRNTVALMRAGLLFQEGLYHEARRELLTAVRADPDEPTLHRLLGHVYERVGLRDLAAQEF